MRIRAPFPKEFFVIEDFENDEEENSCMEALENWNGNIGHLSNPDRYVPKNKFTFKGVTQEQVTFTAKQFIKLMKVGE